MRAAAGDILATLRPPLVYGPGVKANFLALLRLVDSGLPLPFGSIDNRRSLVFLDNLLDLIEPRSSHPEAAGGTFLLRDDEEVSTASSRARIAAALGRRSRLLPCPPGLLRLAASLAGRAGAADRLLSSLRVDDFATRQRLGWRPRVRLEEGLAATARWYRRRAADERVAPQPALPRHRGLVFLVASAADGARGAARGLRGWRWQPASPSMASASAPRASRSIRCAGAAAATAPGRALPPSPRSRDSIAANGPISSITWR